MATHWGVWSAEGRRSHTQESDRERALSAESVAAFIAWIATAPPELVLDETIITPLGEQGYP